jgi:hypothetical protein
MAGDRLAGHVVLVHLKADGKLVFKVAMHDHKIVPFILSEETPPHIFASMASIMSAACTAKARVTVYYEPGPHGARPTSIELDAA